MPQISPITGQPIYRTHREQQAAWAAERAAATPPVTTPTTTTTSTGGPDNSDLLQVDPRRDDVVPGFLSDWDQINRLLQSRQQQANLGRIPGAAGLEQTSSDVIAGLLNPPAYFADTDRRAAEMGAGRGIGGSAAAYASGVRMTDEERLRRQALGQQMLTGAYGRNPSADLLDPTRTYITPAQQAEIDARNRALDLEEERNRLAQSRWDWERHRLEQPSITYSGMGGAAGGAGGRGSTRGQLDEAVRTGVITPDQARDMNRRLQEGGAVGYTGPVYGRGMTSDTYDTTGGYLPLYPGGPVPGEGGGALPAGDLGADDFWDWLTGGDPSLADLGQGGPAPYANTPAGGDDFSWLTDPWDMGG